MTWGSVRCVLLSARGNVRGIHHTYIYRLHCFYFKNKIGFQIISFFSEGRNDITACVLSDFSSFEVLVRVSPTGNDMYNVYSNGNIFCLLLAGKLGVSQFLLFHIYCASINNKYCSTYSFAMQ